VVLIDSYDHSYSYNWNDKIVYMNDCDEMIVFSKERISLHLDLLNKESLINDDDSFIDSY